MRKRRIGFLDIVLALLSIVLILSLLGFVFLAVYPEAGQKVRATVIDTAETLFAGVPERVSGVLTAVSLRAQEGYQYRVRPFFRFVVSPFAQRMETLREKAEKEGRAARADKCLKCHQRIFKKTALGNIYFDHRVHREKGVFCQDCHDGSSLRLVGSSPKRHPETPSSPPEDFCLECHKKAQAKKARAPTDCAGCHPPGSILTSQVYDEERITTFIGVPRIEVGVPVGFEHGRSTACESCHQRATFCDKCHGVREKQGWENTHRADWVLTHRQRIEGGQLQPRDCWECHSANWCSAACHEGGRLIYPLPPGRPQLRK